MPPREFLPVVPGPPLGGFAGASGAPPGWLCRCFLALCVAGGSWAPPGRLCRCFRGPPWVALPVLPGPLRCAEAFCQSFLAIPGGFPRASWPLAGAALFAWVSWPGFPCRALPVHPGPVTGASWPPVTLPGCPGFAFLAFPCFCQAAKTWQHDGGHPADKFFMWQQRKRTVFDQILAEAFLPAKTWPHEALLLHARLPAKSISLQDVRDSRPGRGPASYPDRPRAFKSCGVSLLSLLFRIKRHAGQLARSLPMAPANIES